MSNPSPQKHGPAVTVTLTDATGKYVAQTSYISMEKAEFAKLMRLMKTHSGPVTAALNALTAMKDATS